MSRRQLLVLGVAFEGGLGLAAWGLGWLLDQPCAESWKWRVTDVARGAAASLPMVAAFAVSLVWPVGPLAGIKRFTQEVIQPLFASCTVLDLAVISICAGVGEELLFRGVVQAALSRWLGLPAGLAVASVLFGLLHPFSLAYVVLASAMGVYLGWVWLASGNLLIASTAHAVYDFLVLFFLTTRPPGREERKMKKED